jgi:RNA polymerase sigma factor (sigma-70 family)
MSAAEAASRQRFRARLDRYFRQNYARLIRRWAGRAGSVSEAEDLLQDAFLGLYRAHAEGGRLEDGDDALAAVLEVAIRNKHYDRLRRALLREKTEMYMPSARDEEGEEDDARGLLGRVADETIRTEDEIAVRDLFQRVLALLTPHWRSVIALMEADRGARELADAFGRDGNDLQRQARQRFCSALKTFASTDSIARWIGQRACGWTG